MLVLGVPVEDTHRKKWTWVGFQDTGCVSRMPKHPAEKFAIPLIIQMFFPIKMLNICLCVPIQVIG